MLFAPVLFQMMLQIILLQLASYYFCQLFCHLRYMKSCRPVLRARKKIEAELQQAQLLQEHYKEIKRHLSYMASYEHDLRHQLNLVQTMVSQGKAEEAGSLYQNIPIETPGFLSDSKQEI